MASGGEGPAEAAAGESTARGGPDAPPPGQRGARIHIRVPADAAAEAMGRLKEMIGRFHGDTEVLLHIQLERGERRLCLGPNYLVASGAEFAEAVQQVLGEDAVWQE